MRPVRSLALAVLGLGAAAAGLTLSGPGIGLSGQPVTQLRQAEPQGVQTAQSFRMPVPEGRLTGLPRWWVGRSGGQLTLSGPKISWLCPAGQGRSATRPPASAPRLSGITLRAGPVAVPAADVALTWQGHVLRVPDLTFAVSGPQVLALLDGAQSVTLQVNLLLPGPASAWRGCVPKLHARTQLLSTSP